MPHRCLFYLVYEAPHAELGMSLARYGREAGDFHVIMWSPVWLSDTPTYRERAAQNGAIYVHEHNSDGSLAGIHDVLSGWLSAAPSRLRVTAPRGTSAAGQEAFRRLSATDPVSADGARRKIASGDVVNMPLLRRAANTGLPLIVSTGAAVWSDVGAAHDLLSRGRSPFALLQCTSGYPAKYEELNISVVQTYRSAFSDTVIGFSSHDNGTAMPLLAYALGARIIEKHFTVDRTMKGTDQAFSLSPSGMNRLCKDLRRAHVAMGDGRKTVYESEHAPIRKQRKSIVAARDLAVGTVLSATDLALKIPNKGLLPVRLPSLFGRQLATDLKKDDYLSDDHLVD